MMVICILGVRGIFNLGNSRIPCVIERSKATKARNSKFPREF